MKVEKFFLVFRVCILFTILSHGLFTQLIEAAVPETWLADWNNPPAETRPLQIVHGGVVNYDTPEKMEYFKEQCGLGGLVRCQC
ncbi:MAG: hypothetical protein ACRC2T_10935 [Thermoguttaceae bacterium]